MPADKEALLNEIRYSERLCQRTARLYRHVQAIGTFVTVAAASGPFFALAGKLPGWLGVTGALTFAVLGAAMLATRPADKAATNEADMKRYSALRADAQTMDAEALQAALNKARTGDAAEIEALRDVAYNDLVREIGRDEYATKLSWHQRLIASLA